MTRTVPLATLLLPLVLLLAACGGLEQTYVASRLPAAGAVADADIDASLLLIGDAGERDEDKAPVLATLEAEAARLPGSTLVVFLGDNVYPWGIPDPLEGDAATAKARLRAQLDAARDAGARALFLPGNHDYGEGKTRGKASLERMQTYLGSRGDDGVLYAPAPGATGPVGLDVGDRARVFVLDTQALLEAIGAGDAATVDRAMQDLVRRGKDAGGRHVVVLAHHPVATHGPHGGYYGADHVKKPLIGSVMALARDAGVTNVDLAHADYAALAQGLIAAFRQFSPLAYAAGHEHSLQLLDGDDRGAQHLIVSGAGSPGRLTDVTTAPDTVAAAPGPGFFRMDFLKDGRVRLELIALSLDGSPTVRTAVWLSGPTN